MINARPNLNGNTRQNFEDVASDINIVQVALKQALTNYRMNLCHGRNYQHLETIEGRDAREADERQIANLQKAYNDCGHLNINILKAARGMK